MTTIHHVFVDPERMYRGMADTMPWRRSKFYVSSSPHPRHDHYVDYPVLQYMVAMVSTYVVMPSFMIIGTCIEDEAGWRQGKGCVVVLGDCTIHTDVDGVITTKTLSSGDLVVFHGCARYCITASSAYPITICFLADVNPCNPNDLLAVRRGVGKKRKITYETRTALAALAAGNIICGLR
jgi:hypothetical protein